MMRRGPSGPRTLCNACGLFWANRVSIYHSYVLFWVGILLFTFIYLEQLKLKIDKLFPLCLSRVMCQTLGLGSHFTLLLKIGLSTCSVDRLFFTPDDFDVGVLYQLDVSRRALILSRGSPLLVLFFHFIGNAKHICELLAESWFHFEKTLNAYMFINFYTIIIANSCRFHV